MSSIPTAFDPLGTLYSLPAGYERIESVYKPVNCWWKTDLDARIGYEVTLDATIDNNYANVDIFGTNLPPTNQRIYYLERFNSIDAGWTFGRGVETSFSSTVPPVNRRFTVSCVQADTYIRITQNAVSVTSPPLTPFTRSVKTNFLFGGYTSSATPDGRSLSSMRVYDFKVVDAATQNLLAHFIPIKKWTSSGWEYGLWDTVARKELEKIGTMEA